jgi:hypothetical protein
MEGSRWKAAPRSVQSEILARCLLEWLKIARGEKTSKEMHSLEDHADWDSLAVRRGKRIGCLNSTSFGVTIYKGWIKSSGNTAAT